MITNYRNDIVIDNKKVVNSNSLTDRGFNIAERVVIAELYYDPPSTDTNKEFVVLYNPTDSDVDISSWTLRSGGTSWTLQCTIPSNQTIPAYGYYLIGGSDIATDFGITPDFVVSLAFQNGGSETDGCQLRDAIGNTVDVILYDSPNTHNLTDATDKIGTSFTVDAASGHSLKRKSNSVDYILGHGNGYDSNRSGFDIFDNATPTPKNTLSSIEKPYTDEREVRIGENSSNNTTIENDGTMVAKGNATTWDDLVNSLVGRRLTSAVGTVDYNFAENSVTFSPNGTLGNINDTVGINYQKPHKAVANGVFKFHIHWEQPDATARTISYRYRIQHNNQAKTTSWTTGSVDIASTGVFTYTSGTLNQISNVVEIDLDGTNISDTIQLQFTRTDSNAGDIEIVFADAHYKSDTRGSREEFVK